MSRRGIEISNCTNVDSFVNIKHDGIDFVIIKAITPKIGISTSTYTAVIEAVNAGLNVGVFFDTKSPKEIENQIALCKKLIKVINPDQFEGLFIKLSNDTLNPLNDDEKIDLITSIRRLTSDAIIGCGYNAFKKLPQIIKDTEYMFITRYPFGKNDDGSVHLDIKPEYDNLKYWLYTTRGKVDGYCELTNKAVLVKCYDAKKVAPTKPTCIMVKTTKIRNKPSVIFSKTIANAKIGRKFEIDTTYENPNWIRIFIINNDGCVEKGYVRKTDVLCK